MNRSSCHVTIGEVEFSCDYDYDQPVETDEYSIDPPEHARITNLTIEHKGEDFTGLLADAVIDRITERIFQKEAT